MLASFLVASASLVTTTSQVAQGPYQAVSMSSNGEFIAKNYPPRALKAREQGKVGFRLIVEPDGSLGSCEVTESSRSKALDSETCELILRHARLNPVRNADGRAVRAVQTGYINWVLPKNAPQLASAAPSKGNDPQRIICKRSASTGSLIARTKQCMTAKQWSEAQRIARDTADQIIAKGYFEDGDSCTSPSGLPC